MEKEIGDYRIIKPIAFGGMGQIFVAEQKSLGRKVAVKFLHARYSRDSEYLERFYREVRRLAQIEHPNVVKAIEAGMEGETCYFAMMFIEGRNLKEYLDEGSVFSELQALKIIRDVSSALDYTWEKHRLIHRDIKPENIMLTPGGEVKLMDLGISKSLNDSVTITVENTAVGSAAYMSPEQARAEKDIDFRTDMYSLGATYYHLLTGELPYPGDNPIEIITRQLNERIPDPRKKAPQTSPHSAKLIKKMMAKKKENRFHSWREMTEEAERIIAVLEEKNQSAESGQDTGRSKVQTSKNFKTFRLPRIPMPVKMQWHRLLVLAVLLVLMLMAFFSVVAHIIRDVKWRQTEEFYNRALRFAEKCPAEQRPEAIKLFEEVMKRKNPHFTKLAATGIQSVKDRSKKEKQKKLKEQKNMALNLLKKKSYEFEKRHNYAKAIELWKYYAVNGEYRQDPVFKDEIASSLDYLERQKKKKDMGLLNE